MRQKNQNALKKRISELEGSTMSNISVKENLIQNLKDQLKSKQNDFDAEKSVLLNENNKLLLSFKNFETKINELNDIIDKNQLLQKTNLEGFKSKEAQLQIQLDETALNLKNEMNTNQNLELKIESLQRQDQIYTNMIASLKTRISELEIQLQDYSINQPDLKNKLIEANEKINNLEEEKQRHLSHIELLNTKLNDVDRLKNLENMVQSQRWNELGQLAESMKTLSQNMGTTGSLLNQSLTNTALDESLKNSLKF